MRPPLAATRTSAAKGVPQVQESILEPAQEEPQKAQITQFSTEDALDLAMNEGGDQPIETKQKELKMTPAEGQALTLLKRHLVTAIQTRMETEWPDINRRLRIGEAAQWLRTGAPGRALEVLDGLLADYEAQDQRSH